MAKKKLTYSEAIAEIEEIIDELENGSPEVDQLSVLVEKALKLINECREKLRKTDHHIEESFKKFQE